MNYLFLKLSLGVLATIGLYSVLYRENRFYRLFEHIFLGLASGWTLVAIWTEQLKSKWWDKMLGTAAEGSNPATDGYWAYAFLLPLGLLGYFVFSRRNNWVSRIPIGIILGLWSGQQINNWYRTYGPQINASMRPIVPTTYSSFTVPSKAGLSDRAAADIAQNLYPSQAITNLLFMITVLCVVSYFLFSFDTKNKLVTSASTLGRYLLMIGFGAIFGSTVMMRFTLLIDRMYFIWIEWFKDALLPAFGIR